MNALAKRSELLHLLKKILNSESIKTFSDHIANIRHRMLNAERLVIFGAGQNGKMLASLLQRNGFSPAAFFDDTPSKIGTTICGLPVESVPRERPQVSTTAVVSIFSVKFGYAAIHQRLSQISVGSVSLFEALPCFDTNCLPFYFLDKPSLLVENSFKIEWLAGQLSDEDSLKELLRHVTFRTSLDHQVLCEPEPRHITPFKTFKSLVYVDAGAFDGDTLMSFVQENLESLNIAIGIEPDSDNFKRMDDAIKAAPDFVQKKIRTVQAALDRQSGVSKFSAMHTQESALCDDGNQNVETVSVDDLLKDESFSTAYLKLDIEGAEAQVILGARSLIEAGSVILSISVYHKPDDLWELPILVHSINPDYRFILRSHGCDGADLTMYAFHKTAHSILTFGSNVT